MDEKKGEAVEGARGFVEVRKAEKTGRSKGRSEGESGGCQAKAQAGPRKAKAQAGSGHHEAQTEASSDKRAVCYHASATDSGVG